MKAHIFTLHFSLLGLMLFPAVTKAAGIHLALQDMNNYFYQSSEESKRADALIDQKIKRLDTASITLPTSKDFDSVKLLSDIEIGYGTYFKEPMPKELSASTLRYILNQGVLTHLTSKDKAHLIRLIDSVEIPTGPSSSSAPAFKKANEVKDVLRKDLVELVKQVPGGKQFKVSSSRAFEKDLNNALDVVAPSITPTEPGKVSASRLLALMKRPNVMKDFKLDEYTQELYQLALLTKLALRGQDVSGDSVRQPVQVAEGKTQSVAPTRDLKDSISTVEKGPLNDSWHDAAAHALDQLGDKARQTLSFGDNSGSKEMFETLAKARSMSPFDLEKWLASESEAQKVAAKKEIERRSKDPLTQFLASPSVFHCSSGLAMRFAHYLNDAGNNDEKFCAALAMMVDMRDKPELLEELFDQINKESRSATTSTARETVKDKFVRLIKTVAHPLKTSDKPRVKLEDLAANLKECGKAFLDKTDELAKDSAKFDNAINVLYDGLVKKSILFNGKVDDAKLKAAREDVFGDEKTIGFHHDEIFDYAGNHLRDAEGRITPRARVAQMMLALYGRRDSDGGVYLDIKERSANSGNNQVRSIYLGDANSDKLDETALAALIAVNEEKEAAGSQLLSIDPVSLIEFQTARSNNKVKFQYADAVKSKAGEAPKLIDFKFGQLDPNSKLAIFASR